MDTLSHEDLAQLHIDLCNECFRRTRQGSSIYIPTGSITTLQSLNRSQLTSLSPASFGELVESVLLESMFRRDGQFDILVGTVSQPAVAVLFDFLLYRDLQSDHLKQLVY